MFERVEEVCRVMPIKSLKRPNTVKADDDNDNDDDDDDF
jgi:hypothetical protein